MPYKRILVTTDGSPLSEKAVNHAVDLAASMDAELFVLKVLPCYPQYYFEGSIALPTSEIERIEKLWADEGEAIVEAAKKVAEERGVKVSTILMRGDVISSAIIEAAKAHNVDLIVMASHGRKGVERLLLGSETQQVLVHAKKTPVLVLR
ncbi:MAG: universal stress protein [Ottowia sp.]|nr:universal stress protein [Ottowia sp.]